MKKIALKKGKENFLERKHPWIFSGAIQTATDSIEDGELVELTDFKDEFCAIGFFQPGSIAVRILSFENRVIDQSFWDERIKKAVALRRELGLMSKENNICRLVHGEGDELTGLIIDFYNGVAILQAHAVGMYVHREAISSALQKVIGTHLKAIYSKSAETLPERVEATDEYLFGQCETPHIAKEYGHAFSIDWTSGQKTGFFIDQRENRALLGSFSKGKKVLNTFCYSGGFSIYALANEAKEVHSIDSSAKAIELVDRNVELLDFEGTHQSIIADAVKYMNDLEEKFDVIVLDPPAFAKHKNKRHQAIKAYTRLNANAIRQINPGGTIFTFSCSQVVDPFQFEKAVINAAIKVGRTVQILYHLHQPADHPVSAFHPEGEYLKGLILKVT
ncbi:MAG: class I SAM-dependent rRNA methyltransferase [Bacteroidota bacterium]